MRKLISAVESAAVLGVTRSTFNRWVALGRIRPAVDMDGTTGARLYDAEAVDTLADEISDGAA